MLTIEHGCRLFIDLFVLIHVRLFQCLKLLFNVKSPRLHFSVMHVKSFSNLKLDA